MLMHYHRQLVVLISLIIIQFSWGEKGGGEVDPSFSPETLRFLLVTKKIYQGCFHLA